MGALPTFVPLMKAQSVRHVWADIESQVRLISDPAREQQSRKARLGIGTTSRVARRSTIPGVSYQYHGKHNHATHEYLIIEPKSPPVELFFDEGSETQPAWKIILREVAQLHGLEARQLRSRSRAQAIVEARHEACYRIHKETPLSLTQIASRMGYADHTTVLYAVQQHAKRLEAAEQ